MGEITKIKKFTTEYTEKKSTHREKKKNLTVLPNSTPIGTTNYTNNTNSFSVSGLAKGYVRVFFSTDQQIKISVVKYTNTGLWGLCVLCVLIRIGGYRVNTIKISVVKKLGGGRGL
jgi:hypothetical protein